MYSEREREMLKTRLQGEHLEIRGFSKAIKLPSPLPPSPPPSQPNTPENTLVMRSQRINGSGGEGKLHTHIHTLSLSRSHTARQTHSSLLSYLIFSSLYSPSLWQTRLLYQQGTIGFHQPSGDHYFWSL